MTHPSHRDAAEWLDLLAQVLRHASELLEELAALADANRPLPPADDDEAP